jgi:hypothetical protein
MDPTGYYQLGARPYDPVAGHFLSADPLGHEASMDLYSFCSGDPLNRFDPTGCYGTRFGPGINSDIRAVVAWAVFDPVTDNPADANAEDDQAAKIAFFALVGAIAPEAELAEAGAALSESADVPKLGEAVTMAEQVSELTEETAVGGEAGGQSVTAIDIESAATSVETTAERTALETAESSAASGGVEAAAEAGEETATASQGGGVAGDTVRALGPAAETPTAAGAEETTSSAISTETATSATIQGANVGAGPGQATGGSLADANPTKAIVPYSGSTGVGWPGNRGFLLIGA